jgi:hypothetical protein
MSHDKDPPSLPNVVDEAGDTPTWVPVLGLVLLALVAMATAARLAINEHVPQPQAAEAADSPE